MKQHLNIILAMITLACSLITPWTLVLGLGFLALEIWTMELTRRKEVKNDEFARMEAEVKALMAEHEKKIETYHSELRSIKTAISLKK